MHDYTEDLRWSYISLQIRSLQAEISPQSIVVRGWPGLLTEASLPSCKARIRGIVPPCLACLSPPLTDWLDNNFTSVTGDQTALNLGNIFSLSQKNCLIWFMGEILHRTVHWVVILCKILKVVVTIWTPSGLDNITVSVRVLLSLYLEIMTGAGVSLC